MRSKIILIFAFIVLSNIGCTTSVSKISKDGKVEQVIFPDINTAWKREGTMPNTESLSKVTPNLSKDQIYALIGTPHFNEGFGAVREWDYIFNFKNEVLNNDEVCQFKIIFNTQMRVNETFWKPENCSKYLAKHDLMTTVVTEKVIEREKETVTLSRLKLNSDGFFEFDKSSISDLRPGGKERLDKALSEIQGKGDLVSVKVVGYTDRLGSDEYNIELSKLRANTIKAYIASQGIPSDKIVAYGLGKNDPIVQCHQDQRNAILIDCLQPNRRFEIEIETMKKVSINE